MAHLVKNLHTVWETRAQSLGCKDPQENERLLTQVSLGFPCGSTDKDTACNVGNLGLIHGLGRYTLEKGKDTHFGILAWRISWTV